MLKKSTSKSALMVALVTGNVIWGGTVVHAEEPSEVFTLDQMVVTATRTEKKIIDIPASVSVITAEDIEISGATTVDQVFKKVPGVTVSRTGGLANSKPVVTMRGVKSGSDVLVLVDGQPMVNAYSGTVNFNDIPIESIEKIEVVKGAASSIYGSNAMAGVISITTKNSNKFHAKTSLTYGTNHTWIKKVSVGDKLDKFSYDLYYQGTDSHTYGDTASATVGSKASTGTQTASGYDIVSNTTGTGSTAIVGKKGNKIWDEDNYSGKFVYKFDEDKSLNIGFLRTKNDYRYDFNSHENWLGTTGKIDIGDGKGFTINNSTFDGAPGGVDERIYTIGYKDNENGFTITGGLTDNRSWNGGKYTTSSSDLSAYTSKRYTLGVSKEVLLGNYDNAVIGIQYTHDKMDKIKLSKKNFTDIMQSGQGQSDNYGIYFQNEHKFNDKFSVIGALRYDRWSVKDGYVYDSNGLEDSPASRSDSALSPKIAFNYKFDDTQSAYISWGKAFSAPSLYDMFSGTVNGSTSNTRNSKNIVIANPGLKPQIITTTEAGWKKDFNGKTTIEVAVFHNKIKNISYQSDTGRDINISDNANLNGDGTSTYDVMQNISGGEGETNGIEISVTHKFDNKISLYANATIQNPTITKTNKITEIDKIVRMTPKRLLNIGIDYIDNKFAAELAGSYYSKKYGKADNSDVVTGVPGAYDPVFLLGLNTRYNFDKHHTVEFTVNNLLDRDYYNYSLGQGRNYLLTYAYSF